MATQGKKQFGVWMDSRNATIVGRQAPESDDFVILGHVKNEGAAPNTNEHSANNEEIALRNKFFKEIASHMQNVDELHVTGPGQMQEQFIHFLAETPQYKDAVCTESTSNKMSDDELLSLIGKKYNAAVGS